MPPVPHVLVLLKGLGLGGAERLVVEQVSRAQPDEVRFTVAYIRPDKDHFAETLRETGASVFCLGEMGRWPVALAQLLRQARPDVVHSHSPLPASAVRAMVTLGIGGRPALAYTEHNRWQAYRAPTRLVNALTMGADRQVWSVSEEARASVRPARRRARVEVLHHGVDVEATRRQAASQAEKLPESDGCVLLHVANRRPEKNHEHVIASFAKAASTRPRLRLQLVGQHLDDDPGVRQAIAATGCAERIEVLGYRTDVPGLVKRSDAVVLGSDHEGLPVVVMEALAIGRMVVSTAVGGVPEAVRDGVEGWLVAPRDSDALAEAFGRVDRDPEAAKRMGHAAQERAVAFDSAASVRLQLDRYGELLG